MRAEGLTLPPDDHSIGWPTKSSAGELIMVVWIRESHTRSATTQAQSRTLELAHPKILSSANEWDV